MNETHYFVTANSSAGFVNLIDSNINDLEKIYLLTGNNNKAKHDILTEIASKHKNNGNNLEFIHSSYEPDELDGVILCDIKEGYINDRIFPTINADMYEKITFINAGNQDVSQEYVSSYEELYSKAYSSFTNAIKVHDEWEKIYISNMDFEKADIYTENIIDTILTPSNNENPNNIATVRHRFFGCATYKGSVDFIPELTSSLNKRYFIKGRPGTGKSTMLKKIQAKAIELGFDVDVYHCGLDPNSLDMLIIKPLNICIFDSTAPHEYFPESENDIIIDMYKELITPGTDEKYENELIEITSRYKTLINDGISYMKEAHQLSLY